MRLHLASAFRSVVQDILLLFRSASVQNGAVSSPLMEGQKPTLHYVTCHWKLVAYTANTVQQVSSIIAIQFLYAHQVF